MFARSSFSLSETIATGKEGSIENYCCLRVHCHNFRDLLSLKESTELEPLKEQSMDEYPLTSLTMNVKTLTRIFVPMQKRLL